MSGKVRQEQRPITETEKWIRKFPDLQIIDDETFAKAQKILEENAETHAHHRDDSGQLRGSSRASHYGHPRHLLSGLIESQCGPKLNVGGAHGKYLFCRGYGMGVCSCRTTLQRNLAEQLILQAIGERVLANPAWVDLLHSIACRSYDRLQREAPSSRRTLEAGLVDVNKRIESLVANCENQVVPELDDRLAVLRAHREQYQRDLRQLNAKSAQAKNPPTREWIQRMLCELQNVLAAGGPAAAYALRALVGDGSSYRKSGGPEKSGTFFAAASNFAYTRWPRPWGASRRSRRTDDPPATEVVVIDFRKREQYELIAEEVKRLVDEGVSYKKIGKMLGCSRGLVSRALDYWYESESLERPDGRSAKKRSRPPRKTDVLQSQIMDLFFNDMPILKIADQLSCLPDQVREAVEKWHGEQGLPVPDGRHRRREISRKRTCGLMPSQKFCDGS